MSRKTRLAALTAMVIAAACDRVGDPVDSTDAPAAGGTTPSDGATPAGTGGAAADGAVELGGNAAGGATAPGGDAFGGTATVAGAPGSDVGGIGDLDPAFCRDDPVPLPSEFDLVFTAGRICIPSQVATGPGSISYPVRLELCAYRCVVLDGPMVRTMWSAESTIPATLVVLASAHATRVSSELDCDACQLADPPANECVPQTYSWQVAIPTYLGTPAVGPYVVSLPYLSLQEGQVLLDRLEAGEDPHVAIPEEAGVQNDPERQFVITFDATAAPVADPASIADSDCHDIPAH
jgi:hypothetical protein